MHQWTTILIIFYFLIGLRPFNNFIMAQKSEHKLMKRAASGEKTVYGNSSFRIWLSNTLQTYDSRLRPYFGSKPMRISLRFWLIGISHISEKDMSFTVEMFFHETWTDPRLRFDVKALDGHNPLTLPSDAPELLWLPDTNFLNALSSTSPERGSVSHLYYMKLYDNGTITQSRRISVTAECRMDLTMYPFDKQACRLDLSSYGWTVSDILYEWSTDKDAIMIGEISLQDFVVTRYMTKVVNRTYHAGAFSVPSLCIELHRRSGYYFLQLIVPATAVVASTWISLWLESETKFGDLVAVILAIIFLSYSYNTMMPKVSYVKAMDVYMAACFIFTFLSLTKLAVVKYMHQKVSKNKEKCKQQQMVEAANTNIIELVDTPAAAATVLSIVEEAIAGHEAIEMNEQEKSMLAEAELFEEFFNDQLSDEIETEKISLLDKIFEMQSIEEDLIEIDQPRYPIEINTDQKISPTLINDKRNSPAGIVEMPSIKEEITLDKSTENQIMQMKTDVDLTPTSRMPTMEKRLSRSKSIVLRNIPKVDHPAHHDSYWRCMKAFHLISQLVLPLLFVAFGLFYFFIYPHFGSRSTGTCT